MCETHVCKYITSTFLLLEKVAASGFRGIITYFDDEREESITMDLGMIEEMYKGIDENHF